MKLTNNKIGGYSKLSLNKYIGYHDEAIKLNTGRNCLEYILRAKEYKKIYIPYYICEVIFEPINKLGIKFDYYNIDKNLEPIFNLELNADEVFLYVNYFGIKKKSVEKLAIKFKNLIVDNTQAFFSKPLNDIDTFYSARKFFGVPDGAYLYTNKIIQDIFEQDYSYNRMEHLLIQIDKGTEEGYKSFYKNEQLLSRQPIKSMSKLTKALLSNINYEEVKRQREDNFLVLHKKLGHINEIIIEPDDIEAPFVYPFLCSKGKEIKEKAIDNNLYFDSYWEPVLNKVNRDSIEARLTNNLLPLPVSQMYSFKDIDLLGNYIRNY